MNAMGREWSGRGILGFLGARGWRWALALALAVGVGAAPPARAAFDRTAATTISWFYAAAFSRTPVPNSTLPEYGDLRGLAFWTDAYLTGAGGLAPYRGNVYAIADFFVTSAEFQARYPDSLPDAAFVTALYENMLGRAPDAGGLAFWVGQLGAGASRGTVLADFTNTPENRDSNPLRQAALESFIAFVAADADGTITPAEAAAWLARNPTLDGAQVDGALPNQTRLTVARTGTGSGTVTSNPSGIDCGSACAADFAAGTPVTLTATPASGSIFSGWSGDCGGALCQMAMSQDRNVTATFALESAGGPSEAPRRVDLVAATSLQGDRIQLDWLATFDNDTPSSDIRYILHAGATANFVPTSATARAEVVGGGSGVMTGLTPATLYHVKVQARDPRGHSSWSNELSVTTAAGAPRESAKPRRVLDAQTAPGQIVTTNQIRYQLPTEQTPPQAGDLLVSPEGEGYLRRATTVSQSGSQVTVQTEAAALNEVFDDLQFSTDVRLIDVPWAPSGVQVRALSQGLRVKRSANTRQITWPESGLTLIQTEPPAPLTPAATAGLAPAADTPVVCDGSPSGQRRVGYDAPLKATYPGTVCVEPGSQLSIDISAEIQSGSEADYQVTQLLFLEMTHPTVPKSTANYGAEWTPNQSGSDTQGKGTLRWTPEEQHVDGQLRPYTARFVALAKEREGHCTGPFGWYCQTKKIEFEVRIGVTWGDLPRPEARRIAGGNASLNIDGTVAVDFQPTIRAESDIRWGSLDYGQVVIQGPITFESQVRLRATAAAFYANSQTLVDKRFIKIFWAGNVPIVINGRFTLDLDYKASADAALDLTQSLDIGFDLEAGLEYRDGQWRVLQKAQPWQRFELTGEADARAEVELRFVPDLQISFYDVATGRLILEPYLYGEAALEGHFLYQLRADGSGVDQNSDADYRFTKLEFGGGVDGKFRAGLEAFDKSIVGYPSRDPNQFHEFALLARTPIIGLPELTPRQTPGGNPRDCRAVALTADVENLPNPFRPLFGGPETFNAFLDESAQWQVVLPNGSEALTPGTTLRDVWFSAATSGQYTLRFGGHSSFGSFIRQYQEIQVDYDATANHCGGGSGSGRLNDTGIDWCADRYTNFLPCPVAGYPWQDAQDGRDVTHNDDSDGHAGFSFTKLDSNGNPLAASATSWRCVRDNVTGLIWEVKTDDGGLRDKDNTYTWYNPDSSSNGGNAGVQNGGSCVGSGCDTYAYTQAVNAQGLCGAKDWRLSTRFELESITSNDRTNPAIDTAFFPNTPSSWFWSSSPYAYGPYDAWYVYFYGGYVYGSGKGIAGYVRLVRGGQ